MLCETCLASLSFVRKREFTHRPDMACRRRGPRTDHTVNRYRARSGFSAAMASTAVSASAAMQT